MAQYLNFEVNKDYDTFERESKRREQVLRRADQQYTVNSALMKARGINTVPAQDPNTMSGQNGWGGVN